MLGIDTSKATLQCALRDPVTRSILWEASFSNTPAGVSSLLNKTPAEAPWVIEPTGRYSTGVVIQAQHAGRCVLLAPPRKAKSFLASLQSRAKTDKLDSKGLALYGLSQPLSPYPVKEAAVEKIDQLLSARKGLSNSASRLQLQANELPQAKEMLLAAISDLKSRIKALDKLLAQSTEQEPKMAVAKQMRRVPGIGAVTAMAVTSRLTAKAFAHPDQFVAYIGLDIDIRQSGNKKGTRGLTHQGDAELRRLLYCCAQSSLRAKDSPFKAQYERERAKGLSSTAALCSVARKMAKLCWSLHKHNAVYDPDRVYQAPKRPDDVSAPRADDGTVAASQPDGA
jgi:transposase